MPSPNRALALKPRLDGGGLGHVSFKLRLPGGERIGADDGRHDRFYEFPLESLGERVKGRGAARPLLRAAGCPNVDVGPDRQLLLGEPQGREEGADPFA